MHSLNEMFEMLRDIAALYVGRIYWPFTMNFPEI